MKISVNEEKIKYLDDKSVSKIHGWNLFVPGIRIGAHDFKRFNKQYAYVALPQSEIRVFLRTAIFLEVVGLNINEKQYVIVHDVGKIGTHTWDVPKGQVEYKEFEGIKHRFRSPINGLNALLKEGISRELEEEAKISIDDVTNLRLIPNLVVAGKHRDLPNHFHYQYHIFEGQIHYSFFAKATKELERLRNNPVLTIDMPKDIIEKDNIMLWSPNQGMKNIIDGDPQKLMILYMSYKGL
jgi:8-oxo-dGTP pyrophosphatase MutT (NUDIX family)